MLSYEAIGKSCRTKRNSDKEKGKKLKDTASKEPFSKKQGHGSDNPDKDNYCVFSLSAWKTKKYYQNFKDSNGKY